MPESFDVMAHDAQGQFIWLVVSECVPLVSEANDKPDNVTRNIERWCANGILAPYAHKASRGQVLTLIYTGRIQRLPPKGKEVYLIQRDGLAHVEDRPKRGWPKKKKRERKGKQTGVGTL